MIVSKRGIHKYDEQGRPTLHKEYAARIEYLEGRCIGWNAARGEKKN